MIPRTSVMLLLVFTEIRGLHIHVFGIAGLVLSQPHAQITIIHNRLLAFMEKKFQENILFGSTGQIPLY